MPRSLDKLNKWIEEQIVYNDDGSINNEITRLNYLAVCGESGNVDITQLAAATGVARSQFYHIDVVKERVKKLKENLNKKYPSYFVGIKDSQKTKRAKGKPVEVEKYDKTDHIVKELSRDKSRLEKQLHEERAKNAQLEKDIDSLKKRLQLYGPTIKALQKIGAMPALPPMTESEY